MDEKALEKKERLLAALDEGKVMIHLDGRRPGVSLPPNFRTEAHVSLNLSYRFDPPDLTINEWGIRSTLSFSGSRYGCAIPWSALFAIRSHVTNEFWMFPDDMPPELLEAYVPKPGTPVLAPPARPALRQVGASLVADPSPPPSSVEAPVRSAGRSSRLAPVPMPALAPAPEPLSAHAESEAEVDDPPTATPAPAPASAEARGPEEGPPAPPPKGRGHLRVVK